MQQITVKFYHGPNMDVRGVQFILDGVSYHTFDIRFQPFWKESVVLVVGRGTISDDRNVCLQCMNDREYETTEVTGLAQINDSSVYTYIDFRSSDLTKFDFTNL